jgi:transcription antitermination factor NusG
MMDTYANSASGHWFAVVVKPRHEKSVARGLRSKGLEEFLPLYRQRRSWSDRIKAVQLPMFSGYVFCRFAYPERLRVLSTPGVVCALGTGDVFNPIADAEIATIRAIVDSGVPAKPCSYPVPGDTVRIAAGPLTGISGTVVRDKGVTSVVVSVEILQRSVAVELDKDALRPVTARTLGARACLAPYRL